MKILLQLVKLRGVDPGVREEFVGLRKFLLESLEIDSQRVLPGYIVHP